MNIVLRAVGLGLIGLVFSGMPALAEDGKVLIDMCNACHNADLIPPKAPPFWGVQRRYQKQFPSKNDFVNRIVAFARSPSRDHALLPRAVEKMGLMPPMPLSADDLYKIGEYLWVAEFPPPCTHWQFGAESAQKAGDTQHAHQDQMKLSRFCGN